jgi:GNAT superfamily N-acetyltransferase
MSDAQAIADLAGQLGYTVTHAQAHQRLATALADSRQMILVADAPQGLVGWVGVDGAPHLLADPFAEITGLIVDAPWRGRGVGRQLMWGAIKWAREAGYRHVRARSNVIRREAHGFYVHLDFSKEKSQDVFIASIPP